MNILWHSVAPWVKSGYGIQTAIFTQRIKERLSHDLSIFAYSGLSAGHLDIGGVPILSKLTNSPSDLTGTRVLLAHSKLCQSDIVVSLTDIWTLDSDVTKKIPWAPWFPIDHDPMPPLVETVLKKSNAVPIVFSKFALEKVKEVGLEALFVPHGCHPEYFVETNRQQAREMLEIPSSAFVVGIVGVNDGYPCRKSMPQALEAVARFQLDYPDTFLYFHSLEHSPTGMNFKPLISKLKRENVKVIDPYKCSIGYSEEYMRNAYAAMDVLLCPSMGEGFGIPIIEAQAVGTPVIVSDFTSMTELCFFGELVGGIRFYTSQCSYQLLPDVNQIVEKLDVVKNYSGDKLNDRQKTRKYIKEKYSPDFITDTYWKPVLEECKDRLINRSLAT